MFRRENPFGGAPLLFFAPRRCDFLQERQVDSLSLPRFARELELAPYYFIVFIVYRVQLLPCTTYPNASRLVASLLNSLNQGHCEGLPSLGLGTRMDRKWNRVWTPGFYCISPVAVGVYSGSRYFLPS